MSKYNKTVGICFNDKIGYATYFVSPEGLNDYKRYSKEYGKWVTRFKFLKQFWLGIKSLEAWAESEAQNESIPRQTKH